jgi:hypothetical protein
VVREPGPVARWADRSSSRYTPWVAGRTGPGLRPSCCRLLSGGANGSGGQAGHRFRGGQRDQRGRRGQWQAAWRDVTCARGRILVLVIADLPGDLAQALPGEAGRTFRDRDMNAADRVQVELRVQGAEHAGRQVIGGWLARRGGGSGACHRGGSPHDSGARVIPDGRRPDENDRPRRLPVHGPWPMRRQP